MDAVGARCACDRGVHARAEGLRARGLRRRRDADLDVVLRAPRESVHVESRRTRRRSWRDGRDARHHANLGVRLRLRPRDGVVPRGVQIRTVRAGVRRFDPPRTRTFPAACVVPPRPFATSSAPALRHPLTPRSRRPTPLVHRNTYAERVQSFGIILTVRPRLVLNPSPRHRPSAASSAHPARRLRGARCHSCASSTSPTASALELPLTAQTLTLIRALTLSIFSFSSRRPSPS